MRSISQNKPSGERFLPLFVDSNHTNGSSGACLAWRCRNSDLMKAPCSSSRVWKPTPCAPPPTTPSCSFFSHAAEDPPRSQIRRLFLRGILVYKPVPCKPKTSAQAFYNFLCLGSVEALFVTVADSLNRNACRF
jgi:hypothetical protein